jgi:HSP20 family protein
MKLIKTPPPTMATVRRDLDTLFDRMFRGPVFPELVPLRSLEAAWEPALDLSETEKEYVVRLEAPGFHKENLDVKFEGGMLTLTGHRELRAETKGEEYLWQEREEGRFLRTLRIPAPVQEEKVEAHYENGVLMVRLPKLEPAPKARISIK